MVTAITYADIQFDLKAKDLESYIKQWLTMVKKKEIDAMGLARFVWDKNTENAQDHWVHATVYYWIARTRGGEATVVPGPEGEEKPKLVVRTQEGFDQLDLKEYMERDR